MNRWALFIIANIVLLTPTRGAVETLFISGDNVMALPGAKFFTFEWADINASGDAVFSADLQPGVGGVTFANDTTIFKLTGTSLELLARESSGPVPGVSGAEFASFLEVALDDSGNALLRAPLTVGVGGVTSFNNQGVWKFSSGGNVLLARTGSGQVPDLVGASFDSIPTPLRSSTSGDLVLEGMVSGAGINSTNNFGVWKFQSGGSSLLVQETVSTVPGIPAAVFESFAAPVTNNLDQVAVKAILKTDFGVTTPNRIGIWQYDGTTGTLLARTGVGGVPGVVGASFQTLDAPLISNSGAVAFHATLSTGASGLWKSTLGTASLKAITSELNVPDVAGASFANFGSLLLSDSGQLVTLANLTVGSAGVTSTNSQGLWALGGTAPDRLLLRQGSAGVPGIASANFADVLHYSVGPTGDVLVLASLEVGPGGVTASDNLGLWLLPAVGQSQLLLRSGMQLAGQTITDIALSASAPTTFPDALPGRLNSQGQFFFNATFTSGAMGLFRYNPEPSATGDFDEDGDVDGRDLLVWQRDPEVGDLATWQAKYGNGVGAVSSSTPATTAVPEPHTLGLLGVLFAKLWFTRRPATHER